MSAHDYQVGWIAALPLEGAAALDMFDEMHEHVLQGSQDDNNYILGRIGMHNVVVTILPYMGAVPAAVVAAQMRNSFPSLRFVLLVGIGGGAPSETHDIRLGDVVVSRPTGSYSGVIQYDFGKTLHEGRFKITGSLNRPSAILLNATSSLEARHRRRGASQISAILEEVSRNDANRHKVCHPPNDNLDELFEPSYAHTPPTARNCDDCDRHHLVLSRPFRTTTQPVIHYGLIASANQVMRDALTRDRLSAELDVLCFEMEAAGLMNYFECLVIRGICDYSDSHKNKDWQEYAAATAAAYAKELLMIIAPTPSFQANIVHRNSDLGTADGTQVNPALNQVQPPHPSTGSVAALFKTRALDATYAPAPKVTQIAAQSACLKSLWFTEMDARRDNIERAAEGTCAWLTEHPDYIKWSTESCGLLWVTGSPGAGKSVLMDKLVATVGKRTDDTVIVASFFVHGRGTQMQRSPSGLYRSLLHQILAQSEILRTQLTEIYLLKLENQGEYGKAWNWHEKEMYDFLESRVKEFTSKTITIFVDGLDEFGEEMARKLSADLWSLTKPGRRGFSAIRLCIACRHYPVMDFFGSPQICVENQNSEDISKFVQATLATVFTETDAQNHIETEILHKAAGNFLWTSLILPQIARKGLSGYGLETLRKEIQNSSPELRQIYKEAVDKIPYSEKIYALHLFQWVCLAEEPLSPVQMRYVLSFDASAPARDLVAWKASENYGNTDEQLIKLIKALSGGLVEITGGADMQTATIQCIHQSVKDYFLQQGLQDLEQSLGQDQAMLGSDFSLSRAHELMFKCCMHYILTKEISQLAASEAKKKKTQYPLLQYAVTRWPSHLQKGDVDGTLEKSLLRFFQWPSTNRLNKWLQLCSLDSRACGLQEGAHMLHVAGYYGFSHLIDALVAHRSYKNSNPDDAEGRTPLIYAAANGHIHAANSLISHGANVNAIDNQRISPLWWAATGAHLELMEVLIEHGADLDIQDIWGRTVLLCVAANLNEDAVDTLLFNGANPSLQDDMGRSPLYRTLYNLFGEDPKDAAAASSIVEKLLEHGAQPSKKMSEDDTMLRFAIQQDLHTILDLTLQLDQFANDIGRRTLAFLHALYIWNLPVAIKLIKTGISEQKFIDTTGYTLISYTLLINCRRVTEALIEERACDPNGRGLLGVTPLIATTQLGLVDMMRPLIQIGALVDGIDSDGRTPLSYAAELGQISAGRLLLEHRANLHIKDNTGKNALMWAAEHEHPVMVDLLLSHGADSRQVDNLKRTALFWAAKGGNDSVIRSLIQSGLDPAHRCSLGRTALSWAVMHHQLAAARILIALGGLLDAVDSIGQSPLLWAVSADYFAEVELLLEQGANVDIKDNKHQTALLIAANKGHTRVMRILLKYGADPDVRDTEGFTPLLIAIRNGLTDAIEGLCSASQLDAEDSTGRTPLLYAVMTGNEAVAKCLLDNGAAADNQSYQGRSALSFASQYGYEGIVRMLLSYGVNLNGQDTNGRTALWWAAAYGRDEVLKLLLEKGADVTIPSKSGDSPLSKAVSGGNTETTSFLLKHGSSVNLSDVELSSYLFGLATDNGDSKMVTTLIDEGLDCSAAILPTGRTLLAWAVRYGYLEVVVALASHGIDLEAPCDDQGLTAIDMAFERGHKDIINYLLAG